ncbi:MAG TPA: ferritin [Luteibaculaceae bacterium]|jgi:ferritin|nr:ferritin [Luteibaculaceae bacterium]
MLSKKVQEALNNQVEMEGTSSQYYLAWASWAENEGYAGISGFLYKHADEERMHMLKLIKFVNERGGQAKIPAIPEPKTDFKTPTEVFQELYKHETKVTNEINKMVHLCLEEKDYTTHNFLQWYVSEQMEEEALARTILDKLKLIGNDKGGLYLFDRDIETLTGASVAAPAKA